MMRAAEKTSYILENPSESERLANQSNHAAYNIREELEGLQLKPGFRILDAGCGTGIASRALAEMHPSAKIDACDISEIRLRDAQLSTPPSFPIRYFKSNLEAIACENNWYDLISCRYVVEHLPDPLAVAREFFRALKPGGKARVIDIDGAIFNLYPLSAPIKEMTEKLVRLLPVDLYVGRKLPSILLQAGFKHVEWKVTAHSFRGKELEAEQELNSQRLSFSLGAISKALGSEALAHEFRDRYLEEMLRPGATLFHNKFIVDAVKE